LNVADKIRLQQQPTFLTFSTGAIFSFSSSAGGATLAFLRGFFSFGSAFRFLSIGSASCNKSAAMEYSLVMFWKVLFNQMNF
jgi:hypothetical protein